MADGLDVYLGNSDWARRVELTVRKTQYRRILVNQALAANDAVTFVLNTGLGTKSLHIVFKANAAAQLQLYGVNNDGTIVTAGNNLDSTNSTATGGSLIRSDWGGNPNVGIYIKDTSAAANTIQYVDVWWTNGG